MALPETFKQAVFKSLGSSLVIEEVPLKLPSAGEVLVKVEACGVCASDLFTKNNTMGGEFPIVPGHEIIGRIVALGEGVSGWNLGDRIGGGWHGYHDGTCPSCQEGWYQMCDNELVNGVTKGGGYAEYCLLKDNAGIHLPNTPSFNPKAAAPLLCAGVTVFNSIRNMNLPVGSVVAIQGLGGLGHLAIQFARKMGHRVIAISRGSDKEALARQLGAHEYIDTSVEKDVPAAIKRLSRSTGARLIVTTAPKAEVISPLLGGLGILGKLLLLSIPGPVSFNTSIMLRYGLSVQLWPSGHSKDSEDAVAFAEMQGVECMVEEFPLEKANEAFEAMVNGTVRFRAVIAM